jgi:putative FmdB family regulatory protein
MPVYEFNCQSCGARVSLFFRSINAEAKGVCDRCGSADLQRTVSRFSVGRPPFDPTKLSKQELLDGVDYTNPASMAQFFRRMGETFQDDQNDYMDDIIGRLDSGERVEKAIGMEEHFHGHAEQPAGYESPAGGGDGGDD